MKAKLPLLCAAALLWRASVTSAGVTELEAARLGGDELAPIGAERAGNAKGTIPAWTGGLDSSTVAFKP